MEIKKINEVLLIFGRRGTGKTTLAKDITKERKRIVIFDTLGEYTNNRIIVKNITDFINFIDNNYDKDFEVVFVPQKELEDTFDKFCRLAFHIPNLTILIEEIHYYIDVHSQPDSLETILRLGRHKGISVICVTHRTADIPRFFTSQATQIYTFQQTEPRDLDYFSKIFGFDCEFLRELQTFEYFLYPEKIRKKLLTNFN